MKNILLTEFAKADLHEIAFWYAQWHDGVADAFLGTTEKALKMIEAHPERRAIWKKVYRKVKIGRFPYSMYYSIEGNAVVVHAVIHDKRSPRTIETLLRRK